MVTTRQQHIVWTIWRHEPIGIADLSQKITARVSIPTLNRDLSNLKQNDYIRAEGNGPGTKYRVNQKAFIRMDIDVDAYFKIEVDDRKVMESYRPEIFNEIKKIQFFTLEEIAVLENLTSQFRQKIAKISEANYKREFERLMIELSWKSSQIEGNTYDLLDTEQLLKYNIPSSAHTREETQMLLNHKIAIEYIRENTDHFKKINVGHILDVHTLLVKGLNISKSMRNKLVRITGTKYVPPDNQFVIEEAINELCSVINNMKDAYAKALLALLFISYIQPFDDGNKRTARLVANALLMAAGMCPLSYRSVSPSDYKKSILLFYELNNMEVFKRIFVSQYKFAVENYF